MDEILKALQPRQLGAGTPDGVVLAFKLLQEWACILEADGPCTVEALDEDAGATEVKGLVAADLTNAYGMFFRSAALRAASDVSPTLAAWMASEFSCRETTYWQSVDGAWVSAGTTRGYWQGRKLAMLAFCASLLPVWAKCPELLEIEVASR